MESTNRQASREARCGRGRGDDGLKNCKSSNINITVDNCSSVDVSNLFCYYSNVDSLSNKWDEFCVDIKNKGREPDIIMLNEVLPKNFRFQLTKAEIALEGYEMFTESFSADMSRGTVIYVKETLKAVEVKFDSSFEESTWVKLTLRVQTVYFADVFTKAPPVLL